MSRTVNGVLETYSYDAGDKLLAVSGGLDPRTFVYDAAGRTTSIVRGSGTTSFVYDYESRVVSVSGPGFGNSMAYNGLDTRVSLADSGGTKVFKRDGVSVTAPVLGDGTAVFSPGVGEKRGSVKTYFHHGLKNTDAQSSAAGVLSAVREYDAFGNVVSGSGAWASQFGNAGRFGYQEDGDSGLKLLGHRYYDSGAVRFLTRDPAKDGRNWYGYCGNSPVGAVDPSGLMMLVAPLGLNGESGSHSAMPDDGLFVSWLKWFGETAFGETFTTLSGSGGTVAGAGMAVASGGAALGSAIKPLYGWRARNEAALEGDFETAGISAEDAFDKRMRPRYMRATEEDVPK